MTAPWDIKLAAIAPPPRFPAVDPGIAVALSSYRQTKLFVPASTNTNVLPSDIGRLAFTVLHTPTSTPDWLLSPYSAAGPAGLNMVGTEGPIWITVKDHGSLCCAEWYAYSVAGGTIYLLEVYKTF